MVKYSLLNTLLCIYVNNTSGFVCMKYFFIVFGIRIIYQGTRHGIQIRNFAEEVKGHSLSSSLPVEPLKPVYEALPEGDCRCQSRGPLCPTHQRGISVREGHPSREAERHVGIGTYCRAAQVGIL